jgi:hypothetical protein
MNGLVCGLVPHNICHGFYILQYAHDRIVMFQDNLDMALNVNILLYPFEDMVALKIIFYKREIIMVMKYRVKLDNCVQILNC